MNCLVTNNLAQGIYVSASNAVKVFNNTVVDNWAGIVLHGMPRQEHPTLNNNIVRNNILSENQVVDFVIYTTPSETSGNSSDFNLYYRSDGTIKISWTNQPGYEVNYTDLNSFSANTGQEKNSLNTFPMWINAEASKYALQPDSPAIDSGTLELSEISEKDLSGLFRVVDGNNDGIPEIDIGAYEFQIENLNYLAPPKKLRVIDQ